MTALRVLLVDDRAAVRLTVQSVLDGFACEFAEAAGGEEALALMQTIPFDVIFLDLKLPDISGIEVLRRARERCQPLGRVIILTGFLDPAAQEESRRLGAFIHLTKDPLSHDEVSAAFISALAREECG
jgi:CheY-like chemotaxis protein